jgi:hypothetical protein
MPAWLDNAFHSHGKRERVSLATDGLLARAISRCDDLLTDGFVEATWIGKQLLDGQLTPKQRKLVLELAVKHRVLEPLAAGESRVAIGAARPGLRTIEIKTVLGPYEVDGYIVHDFLDCNRASDEVSQRRGHDRQRQRKRRGGAAQDPLPWEQLGVIDAGPEAPSSSSNGVRVTRDNARDTGARRRRSTTTSGVGLEDDASARACSADPTVQAALDVLAQAPRLHVQLEGIENAIAAWPKCDPVRAARRVVTWGTDPAYRITNAATLMWKALEELAAPPPDPFGGGRFRRTGRATPADFQALKGGAP